MTIKNEPVITFEIMDSDVIEAMEAKGIKITERNFDKCVSFIKAYFENEHRQEGHLAEDLDFHLADLVEHNKMPDD